MLGPVPIFIGPEKVLLSMWLTYDCMLRILRGFPDIYYIKIFHPLLKSTFRKGGAKMGVPLPQHEVIGGAKTPPHMFCSTRGQIPRKPPFCSLFLHLCALKMRMEQLLFADENAPEWAFSKRKGVKESWSKSAVGGLTGVYPRFSKSLLQIPIIFFHMNYLWENCYLIWLLRRLNPFLKVDRCPFCESNTRPFVYKTNALTD